MIDYYTILGYLMYVRFFNNVKNSRNGLRFAGQCKWNLWSLHIGFPRHDVRYFWTFIACVNGWVHYNYVCVKALPRKNQMLIHLMQHAVRITNSPTGTLDQPIFDLPIILDLTIVLLLIIWISVNRNSTVLPIGVFNIGGS